MKKILLTLAVLSIVGVLTIYFNLTKQRKNQVKQLILHNVGILNSEWEIDTNKNDKTFTTHLKSPSLYIDDIYTSMEGPYTYKRFRLNDSEDKLYWVKGFKADANTKFKKSTSNDFICHVNFYHSSQEHFSRLGFNDRIGTQRESQMILLTTGGLNVEFPKGFAYPIYSNEKLLIGSMALNLNKEDENFNIDYDFVIDYEKEQSNLKPLYMRYVVVALPYEDDNQPEHKMDNSSIIGFKRPSFVECAGPSSNNFFRGTDDKGQKTTSFWKIPEGEYIYKSDITYVLNLEKEETIHYINIHAHPTAESLSIFDETTNEYLYQAEIINSKEKKAIVKLSTYSSEEGLIMYPDHKYQIVLKGNNNTGHAVDMMANMFLYFYDSELDNKLKSENN